MEIRTVADGMSASRTVVQMVVVLDVRTCVVHNITEQLRTCDVHPADVRTATCTPGAHANLLWGE